MKTFVLVLVLVQILVLGRGSEVLAGPQEDIVEQSGFTLQPDKTRFKQLTIENLLGDVVVVGHDGGAIRVETTKGAADEASLERLRVTLLVNPDGSVRFQTTADRGASSPERPTPRGNVRINLTIHAPRNVRLDAATSSGAIEVSNMDAGGELETGSGKIKVKNVSGKVLTHSVSGETFIVQVWGSVDSQSLSSDLHFDTIAGDRLIASANHGAIAGRRVRTQAIELTTHTGKIDLEAEAGVRGRIVVASVKGDVNVRLRRLHHALMARARGRNVRLEGLVVAQGPDGWTEGRKGVAGPGFGPMHVELRSHTGDVTLTLAEW